VRKYIVNRSAFAISYGWQSTRYLGGLRNDLPVVIGRNTTSIGPTRVPRTEMEALELLTVGRAEKGKALDVLIAAVSNVTSISWRLSVIGDGPQLSKLMRDAPPRVCFHGAMAPSDVLRAHSKADIFLFPSRYDIFGLVLVEAMGAGTAVVVSRNAGAVSDLVVNGVNAVFVEDHDPRNWAAAIRRLARDPELRSTLGENARATIRRRWTIEHAADAMVAGLRLGLLKREGW
jgi:glycosyltransferase involved in cell wall biosynthesis